MEAKLERPPRDALGWQLGDPLGRSLLKAIVGSRLPLGGTRLRRLLSDALGWPLGDPLGGSLQVLMGTRLGLLLGDTLD